MSESTHTAPPKTAIPSKILGWVKEACQEGGNFLQTQMAYQDAERLSKLIFCPSEGLDSEKVTLSKVAVQLVKANLREDIANLTNIRPFVNFTCQNPEYEQQARILNGLTSHWWMESFVDRAIRKALQYSAAHGTGYLEVGWKKSRFLTGGGDIFCSPLRYDQVLPVQLPQDGSIQDAYATIIWKDIPINIARKMFPTMAAAITPSSMAPANTMLGKIKKLSGDPLAIFGKGKKQDEGVGSFPLVRVFYVYVMDHSVNTTGREIPMGKEGTSWHYKVPYEGQPIPQGFNRFNELTQQFEPVTIPAGLEEAELYPLRRLIVCTSDLVLYDDTNHYWHGMVPVVPFYLDDWAGQYLGLSLAKDPETLERSINNLLRGVDDAVNVRLDPPLGFDENFVSPTEIQEFNPRVPGQRIPILNRLGDIVKPLLPDTAMRFDGAHEHIEAMVGLLDRIMSKDQLSAITKAAQLPASDSIEKIIELTGPVGTDRARNMEASLKQLGELLKYNFMQFYTAKKRVQILGPDGITLEDLDYDPKTLVPDYVDGLPLASRMQRAQHVAASIPFVVTPNSLLQQTQTTRKLMSLQLKRGGGPIAWKRILKDFDYQDVETIFEEWKRENIEMAEAMVEAQIAAMRKQMESDPQMMAMLQLFSAFQGMNGGGDGSGNNSPGQPQKSQGRPPSGQQPPTIKTKDGGTRTTVSESG